MSDVEKFRQLVRVVDPATLTRDDYLALLSLAQRIPTHNSGGGACSRAS